MAAVNIENVKKPVAALYPSDVGLRCVEVYIPDHDGYLWVLAAFVAILGNDWSWLGTKTDRQSRAQLWQTAYAATLWDMCMKCEDLQECLQPLFDDLGVNIVQQIANLGQFGTPNPGQEMTPEESGTDIAEGTNPTCDYDILWAQSLALVQFTNRAIEDVFEAIESASNVVELTDVIESLPLVQYVSNFLGIDFANDLVNYYQEAVQEGYLAQYTETLEQELACAVFCAANSGCAITVDLLYDVFYSRVIAIVPDNPTDALELLALLAGISINSTTVVDLMFWFAWAGAKLVSFFISKTLANLLSLQQLLNLAVNDASDDWIILCENCPEEFLVLAISDPADDEFDTGFDVTSGTEYQMIATGTWNGGTGIPYDADGDIGTTNPAAYLPSNAIYCLMYRVGLAGAWTYAGADITFTPGSTDRLYLAMNDVPGAYTDNSGGLSVSISAT